MPQPSEAVLDRKTRPIYDALNRGDSKAALKASNQALSKYPGHPLFTVLKAYAYDRIGNSVEAEPLIQHVIDHPHANEDSLYHASSILKNSGDFDKLLELYSKACERRPGDIVMLQQLFLAHARLGNAVKQQQTAMKLNKQDSSELHAFWVICSMLTQADSKRAGDTTVALSESALLQMAEALAQKRLQQDGSLTFEALLVYLDVLAAQHKFAQAQKLLQGPCSSAVHIPHELLRLKAQLAMRAKDLSAAAELLTESLLEHNADDWSGYIMLIACKLPGAALPFDDAVPGVFEAESGFSTLASDFCQESFWSDAAAARGNGDNLVCVKELAHIFAKLQVVSGGQTNAGLERGPYLACVELAWRAAQLGVRVDDALHLVPQMTAYFDRFQTKAVACVDLLKFAHVLDDEQKTQFCEYLTQIEKQVESQVAAQDGWQMPQIRVITNCMRLKQAVGQPNITCAADARAHASLCMDRYAAWRPAGAECSSTEFGVGEEAVEAAVAALVAAYGFDHDMAYLVQVALRDRPSSPALRLALCGLSSLLGMPDLALDQMDALQLRQVQLDSMAHHILPILATHGHGHRTSAVYRQMLRVQEDHDAHTRNAVADCYTNGTFSKILEFRCFLRRGRNSASYHDAATESALMQARRHVTLREGTQTLPCTASEVQAQAWSALSAIGERSSAPLSINSDLSQLPPWISPPTSSGPDSLLRWWEEADSETCRFGRPRWWASPGAASAATPEADSWRKARTASSAERSQLVCLLSGALLLPQGCNVSQVLPQLLQSMGTTWLELAGTATGDQRNAELRQLNSSKSLAAAAPSLHLRRLRAFVLACAAHVQHECNAIARDHDSPGEQQGLEQAQLPGGQESVRAAQSALEHLNDWLIKQLLAAGSTRALVDGAAMQTATMLLAHELTMAGDMILVWEDRLRGQANGGGTIYSHVQALALAVQSACSSLQSACNAAASHMNPAVGACTGVDQTGMQLLLKCTEETHAQLYLQQVVESQRTQLDWLANSVCKRTLERVKAARSHAADVTVR